jgi:hypothetical protein
MTGWLSRALFGPERMGYWRSCLEADGHHQHTRRAPAAPRLAEIADEIADLTRRLQRQIRNLEDDAITEAGRRQITRRIGELEAAIDARQALASVLERDEEQQPAGIAAVEHALDRLPRLPAAFPTRPTPRRAASATPSTCRLGTTQKIASSTYRSP